MAPTFKIAGLCAALAVLSACESSDINRAALGGVSGALIAEATGGDAVDGAAIGIVAGTVCDDLTPQFCN
jgi:hypothetical protein